MGLFIFRSKFCQDRNLIRLFLFFQAKAPFGREGEGTNGSFLYQRVPNAGAFGTLIVEGGQMGPSGRGNHSTGGGLPDSSE